MNSQYPNLSEKYWYLKHGFFSWTGTYSVSENQINFTNTKLPIYIFLLLSLLLILILWMTKRYIYQSFINNAKLTTKKQKNLLLASGIIIFIFMIIRMSLVFISHFPRQWEGLPLHFCRIICLMIAIIFILNKPQWMKYIAPMAIAGALLALSLPDTISIYEPKENFVAFGQTFSKGSKVQFHLLYNNFYYWDFVLCHVFVLITPVIISILYPYDLRFKDTLITTGIFGGLLFFSFLLNLILGTYGSAEWRSNYWYVGMNVLTHLQTF
ncbi:YwaF family protein [Mycoplasma nasistruthionis]|uniref:YwaF family protein n=1 Tax=Mycoplasma nasistruthionis TaxID=353852 RepID=A0A5B7XV66_9MOLU|nr:YwaF family protein [Mycoplasma nasistruthionis]QCZ36769.1 hypothetical protein FG904_01965 [Mycoplasma nasistruthionis]